MRSLVLGAGGQIGAHLLHEAKSRGHVVHGTWYRRPLGDCQPLDLCDAEAVGDCIHEFEPECIFLAAGMSQVDFAESHAAECNAIATDGTANVAAAAVMAGAKVVLFTSEQVVGECQHPADETTACDPLSVYAKAQIAAETLLRRMIPDHHLIVRTSCVYGRHERPRNVAAHALRRLAEGHTLTAAKDRFIQPTFAEDLARATFDCLAKDANGTIHIVGGERLTEASFLKQVAFVFGCDSDLIEPVPAVALCEDAPRPFSPWLDRARLRTLIGSRSIRSIGDGLRAMRDVDVMIPVRRAA